MPLERSASAITARMPSTSVARPPYIGSFALPISLAAASIALASSTSLPLTWGLDGGSFRSKPATDLPSAVIENLQPFVGALDRQVVGQRPAKRVGDVLKQLFAGALGLGFARARTRHLGDLPQKAGKVSMGRAATQLSRGCTCARLVPAGPSQQWPLSPEAHHAGEVMVGELAFAEHLAACGGHLGVVSTELPLTPMAPNSSPFLEEGRPPGKVIRPPLECSMP